MKPFFAPHGSRFTGHCFGRAALPSRLIPGFTAAVLVILLASCGSTRPSKYYTLELPSVSPAAALAHPVSLLVGKISTPHVYRDDRIIYRSGESQLGMYESHRWAEPPAEMIEAILTRALRGSGRYRTVQPMRSNARGGFILRGRLQELSEVSGSALSARLVVEFELYDQAAGVTVWNQFYSHDEPVTGKEVSEVVAALNRNIQRAVAQAAAGIDQYFTKNPPKSE